MIKEKIFPFVTFLGIILVVLGINLSILVISFIIFPNSNQRLTIIAIFALVTGLISALVYPIFSEWISYCLFALPRPPLDLIEDYTEPIITSLELENLRIVLLEGLFPRLGVLSSALLRIQALPPNGQADSTSIYQLRPLFVSGVQPDQLPTPMEIDKLLKQAAKYRYRYQRSRRKAICPWVRLVLLLELDEQLIGLCLLGKRSPDDIYSVTEIPTLQVLMNQTALAIKNIDQAQHLRDLYQTNISHQEEEMARMARELHDDVLGQLAMLSVNVDDLPSSPAFIAALQDTTQSIREIIGELRPATLTYGLPVAFEEMVDEITPEGASAPKIEIATPSSNERYPAEIELHLYRIVQEAFQNAIQYAQAKTITIQGKFEPGRIQLVVEDDGHGFYINDQTDLTWLLAKRYFGLATMYERATIIGAQVNIQSAFSQGTSVTISWEAT